MESRGSASPKSYTSHSSLEDKFPASIRMAPIPECIKMTAAWNEGSRASIASLDSHTTESGTGGRRPSKLSLLGTQRVVRVRTAFSVLADFVGCTASIVKVKV